MGGCSSKPKTTEFEGAMDLQEDKPQDEPARKCLDSEKKGVDTGLKSIDREQKGFSERSLQTLSLSVENERGDLRDVLLESEKQPIEGFNPEDNGKKAEEKSEETCDHSSAKHTKGETLGPQKELSVTEGETRTPAIVERQIAPEREALKLQKEPVLVAAEAEIPETLKESVIVSEESLQKEPDETLELPKEPIVAEEEASELQKEPIVAGEETAELQEEAPGEVEKESEQSQTQKPIFEDNGIELDAGPGCGGGAKQGAEESKEGQVVNDGTETVACKVDSAEREEEILKKTSKPVKEEEKAQSEVIDEAAEGQSALITSRSTAETSTTSSNPPSEVKENDTSCVVPPAMTDLPEESTLPADETEALISQEPAPIEVPKESMDSVKGEQINSPIIYDASESSTSDQVKAPQDLEVSEGLVVEHEEHPAASQPYETREVTATTENGSRSEVQSVHVAEGNKPAKPLSSKYISAQDIAPPDIDEVLEKLASEFERQESLSSSMPRPARIL